MEKEVIRRFTKDLKESTLKVVETTFLSPTSNSPIEAVFLSPSKSVVTMVFGHGAGAGMRHPFMDRMARELAARGVATYRYQFPYMQQRRRRPDPPGILKSTVRAAIEAAKKASGSLPLLAGGKSMGGRMTSQAEAEQHLDGVSGLVFFGFPLHPPGNPSTSRADHLDEISLPMLFLQGTRDKLADLQLLRAVCNRLEKRSMLYVVEEGDHSFHLPKSSQKTDLDVLSDLADVVQRWVAGVVKG